jgi:hypothetical protein
LVGVAVTVDPSLTVPLIATDRLELSTNLVAVALLFALTSWLVSSVKEACTRTNLLSSPSATT